MLADAGGLEDCAKAGDLAAADTLLWRLGGKKVLEKRNPAPKAVFAKIPATAIPATLKIMPLSFKGDFICFVCFVQLSTFQTDEYMHTCIPQ